MLPYSLFILLFLTRTHGIGCHLGIWVQPYLSCPFLPVLSLFLGLQSFGGRTQRANTLLSVLEPSARTGTATAVSFSLSVAEVWQSGKRGREKSITLSCESVRPKRLYTESAGYNKGSTVQQRFSHSHLAASFILLWTVVDCLFIFDCTDVTTISLMCLWLGGAWVGLMLCLWP